MNQNCLKCGRLGGRNSHYQRKGDGVKVTQYRCRNCKFLWTNKGHELEKGQHKRSENETIRRLLCSAVSMRRAAQITKVSRNTIDRRVNYLAKKAELELEKYWQRRGHLNVLGVWFDDLITFEHTRCKPLAVCLAVSERREILGFAVSQMPPSGRNLRRIAEKKYGKRKDLRKQGLSRCLKQIARHVGPHTKCYTDQEPSYGPAVTKQFPGCTHYQFPSKRAVIAGQGELKDHSFDPLFPINHTLAMLRANLARLIRRTWATTKKAARLEKFLLIYAAYHNEMLEQAQAKTPALRGKQPRKALLEGTAIA
jgi:transposase-like protein